jgi:LemA protein
MTRRWLALLLPLTLGGCGYNTIQNLDEQANAAQGQIEVQLQRRADLIPNLVATVKGLANQELAVFTEVARARGGLLNAVQSKDPEQMAQANATMNGALGRLLAVSEAYPQLKSDQGFLKLQDELTGTQNRIATSQTDYNGAVQQYNAYIRQFPAVLTAKMTGAKEKKYFQVTNPANRETPTVDFGTPGAPATSAPAAGTSAPTPAQVAPPGSGASPPPATPARP